MRYLLKIKIDYLILIKSNKRMNKFFKYAPGTATTAIVFTGLKSMYNHDRVLKEEKRLYNLSNLSNLKSKDAAKALEEIQIWKRTSFLNQAFTIPNSMRKEGISKELADEFFSS